MGLARAFSAVFLLAISGAAAGSSEAAHKGSQAGASAATLLAEVRHSFTLHGKTIPPEIFRDLGDGDIADSGSIWVTVDIEAAIGSNLYADPITVGQVTGGQVTGGQVTGGQGWVSQKKTNQSVNGEEETGYRFIGATDNGLLVALASYNGGGSGDFITLHILDVAAARAFDGDGKLYQRINVTAIRSIALGDRWDGDVSISKNSIRVVTKRDGPAGGARAPLTVTATRP